jgi:hypothetical protein
VHPVKIDDGEFELLNQAKESRDWTILPTWKLRYLYIRGVALSTDLKTVKEIATLAHNERNKDGATIEEAKMIFG